MLRSYLRRGSLDFGTPSTCECINTKLAGREDDEF